VICQAEQAWWHTTAFRCMESTSENCWNAAGKR